jgi:hypothetical protein
VEREEGWVGDAAQELAQEPEGWVGRGLAQAREEIAYARNAEPQFLTRPVGPVIK